MENKCLHIAYKSDVLNENVTQHKEKDLHLISTTPKRNLKRVVQKSLAR